MNSKILIISFYFPPFPMVAARRWAKHLKYMFRDGVDFQVLTREFGEKDGPWNKDISEFKNKITRLNFVVNKPYFKLKIPTDPLKKFVWKLSYLKWKYIKKPENTLLGDDSIGAEKSFLTAAEKLITENSISHVVVTVGPHRFSTILITLKSKFPKVSFTIDYRDYWHDNKKQLGETIFKNEMRIQDEVLNSVDSITVVNEEMKEHFARLTKNEKKVLVLPHCYDPEDLNNLVTKSQYSDNKLKFVYGGALYNEMNNYVKLYTDFILKINSLGIISQSDFYLPYPAYEKEFERIKETVTLSSYMSSNAYLALLNEQKFALYFRPDWSPNAFSSKFFELLALKKPILYFGPTSAVSEFLTGNNLGIHFCETNFKDSIDKFDDLLQNKWQINLNYDLQQHTFDNYNQELYRFLGLS